MGMSFPQGFKKRHETFSDEGFSTGETDFPDTEISENAAQKEHILVGKNFLMRNPIDTVSRHTVDTTKITSICH